jgi:MFS transporter, putative metabolite transport protein
VFSREQAVAIMSNDVDTAFLENAANASAATPGARSPQSYIDEKPIWADGTPLSMMPMTSMQWLIWWLAAAGKFFEGMVVFMTGVAIPLVAEEFKISKAQHGLVGAASLAGILVGAIALGSLSDYFGRRRMFIVEMFLFLVFLVLVATSQSFAWLVVCLFGIGLALGCDYPTAHLMISESIPSSMRGRLVLAAFGFQAVGALIGTMLGYLVLKNLPEVSAWRWMFATAIVPAALVAIWRFRVAESATWLLHRGEVEKARTSMRVLLARLPQYPRDIRLLRKPQQHRAHGSYLDLFKGKNLRATVFASVPWFLQDLGTYGIGIFTPTILAATLGHRATQMRSVSDMINNDKLAAKGSALIDVLLIVGVIAAVLLADRVGRIRLQVVGFIGCALGLFIASLSTTATGARQTVFIFAGFMLFNFMTNMGPNAQTYLLAGEVFPTKIRGQGAGFAAAFAKIGAVTTAYLFPIFLAEVGTRTLLSILIGTSLLGALVTWFFGIETTGVDLDTLE